MPPPSAEQAGDNAMRDTPSWRSGFPESDLLLALNALDGTPAPQAEHFLQWALGQRRDAKVLRHGGWVTSCSFSPNGEQVVTGSMDRHVRVWDAASAEKLASFDIGVPSRLWSGGPQFLPGGEELLITGVDGRVYVVPWRQAALPPPLRVSVQTRVSRAAVASDGDALLTGHVDGTVRVTFLARSGDPLVLAGTPTGDGIASVAVGPGGQHMAAATRSGKVWLWDLASPGRRTAAGHRGHVNMLAFSPDGKRLASASDDMTVRLYAVSDGHLVAVLPHHDRVSSVSFAADGERLVTAGVDRIARVFEASTGALQTELPGASEELFRAVFSPDGRLVAMACLDGTCRVCYASNGQTLWELRQDGPILAVDCAADSKSVVTAGVDKTARVWSMETGRAFWGHHGKVNTVAVDREYRKLVTACEDGRARVFDVESGELIAVFAVQDGAANGAEFSRDGTHLIVAGQDGGARVVELESGALVNELPHPLECDSAAFGAEDDRAVTSTRREVVVWNWKTGERLLAMGPSEAERTVNPFIAIIRIGVSPDGGRAASSHYDEQARVWNLTTGAQEGILLGHQGLVYTATFSPGGDRIITSGGDATARVYDAASLRLRHVLVAPSGQLRSAALNPSGTLAAGCGMSGYLTIWHVATERVLCMTKQHADLGMSVAFCGEQLVATASDDGTVKIFDIASCRSWEEQLAAARQLAGPAVGDQ